MFSKKQTLLNKFKEKPYARIVLIVGIASILLTANLATIGQPRAASADKVKVEEFYGIFFRDTSVVRVSEPISDCGDADPSTDVRLQTSTGTVTYTGFIEGTGEVLTKQIVDTCIPGIQRSSSRLIDTFESLKVAGKTGGAVIERVVNGETIGPGQTITQVTSRILCGTGDLKSAHGEGTSLGSATPTSASSAGQFWIHFGHNHDVGYDFLCEDL